MGALRAASKWKTWLSERCRPVMVVDDHPIWRDAVARDLADDGFDVVATADGVAAARRRAAVVKPDVVLMDMQLADGNGVQATTEVLAVSPASRVLVLSASDERDDVLDAVKAGATGYLVKSASKAELREAVRATAAGRAVFTPSLAGLVLGEYRRIARARDDGTGYAPASPSGRPKYCATLQKGCPPSRSPRNFAESPDRGKPRPGDVPQAAGGQPGGVDPLRHRARPGRVAGEQTKPLRTACRGL